jgi:hypothetical protein
MVENNTNPWTEVTVIKAEYQRDVAAAVRVSLRETGRFPPQISYTCGIVKKIGDSEEFKPFVHLPHRFAATHALLLAEAVERTDDALIKARRQEAVQQAIGVPSLSASIAERCAEVTNDFE